MLLWADQIICSTNNTRISLNNQIRELLGRSGDPQEGEKVICLKNEWDDYSDNGNPLVNGTIGYLKNPFSTFLMLPTKITRTSPKKIDLISSEFVSDTDESYGTLTMDKNLMLTGEPGLDPKLAYRMGRSWRYQSAIPCHFTYGYAITCHKSQGSE